MKKKNPLGLRVLSTAAIMSIITSIAAPAFAGTYYIGNDTGDLEITANADGSVTVKHGSETFTDQDEEIIIKGGKGTDKASNKDASATDAPAVTTIGETEVTPVEEEPKEDKPVEAVQKETPAEEPAAEQPEPEEETKEQAKEPEKSAGDEQPKPEAPAAEADTEETPDEDTEETEEEDAEPAAEEETPVEEDEVPKTTEEAAAAPAKREIAKAPVKQQPEAVTQEPAGANPVVQAEDETPAETPNTISIKNDWKTNLKIILDNVHIKASGSKAAMSVTGKESTTVELDGANVLDSSGTSGNAGLEVGEGTTVTITDTDGTVEDSASLKATGGSGGAGIGGAVDGKKVGNIIIEGTADVTATGSEGYYEGASGIGTGGITSGNFPNSSVDSITIGGDAKVKATGVGNAASGIGGSYMGEVGDITITGNADVTAKGQGVGIGAGQSTGQQAGNKDNTTITINDHAKVDASGSTGIGSDGQRHGKVNINLADFAKVKAASTSGAAIGTGIYSESDLNITIGTEGKTSEEEHVEVDAEWKGYNSRDHVSAAIGGGAQSRWGVLNILIQGGAVIKQAKTGNYGCGIGSGDIGNQGVYPLSGSIIIKDDAKVEYAHGEKAIGFSKDYKNGKETSDLKILGNATLENLQGYWDGIGANKVTIGDDTGKVTIKNLETSHYANGPLIRAEENLTIASNADITLTQPTQERKTTFIQAGVDADGNGIYLTKEDVEKIIGDNGTGKITYRIKNKTTGEYTLQYVAHGKDGCVWVLDESQSVASTCTTKGKAVYVCELEDGAVNPACHYGDNGTNTKTIELELADHSWNEGKVTTPATCTMAGVKTYTCTVCHATKTEEIAPTGHNWGEWTTTKKATCTVDGVQERVCKNDPTHKETKKIDATGHAWVNDGAHVDATCTTDGYQDQKCTNDGCDATQRVWDHPEDTEHKGDGTSHDYKDQEWVITPATCTKDGQKVKHCTRAPEDPTHDEVEVIPATGHEKTHVEGKKEPTCEEPGYTGDKVCDKCGEVVEKGEVIPAKGHTPTVVGRKDPTETEPGYTGDTVCADCGKLLEKGHEIPATGKKDAENAEAPELRVVVPGSTLRELWFTVRQSGGERTYTCKQDNAILTGSLETLQYLQSQGADTIVFVTNGRVSRFAVADLLALCNEGDAFYLCHTADAEPTLLIIANDHTELLNS